MSKNPLKQYQLFRASGLSGSEAAAAAGITRHLGKLDDAAGRSKFDDGTFLASMHGNGLYSGTSINAATSNMGVDLEQLRLEAEFPEGVEDNKRIWEDIWDVVSAGIDTIAAPQQLLWRKLSKDEWRKAVPDWMAPQEWKERGIEHEFIMIGDVVDAHIDGDFHKMLEELDEGGWFKKWVLGGSLKVAEFGADAILDPANLLVGAGIGTKMVRAARRVAPLAVQAEHSAKIALKSRSLIDIDVAIKDHKKWIQDLAKKGKANPGSEVQAQLGKAVDQYKGLVDDRRYYMGKGEGKSLAELVPHTKPELIPDPAKEPNMWKRNKLKARKKAAEARDSLVRFEDMDAETFGHRVALGPDDAEMVSESLHRLILGADDNADVIVRNVLDDVLPTTTSIELRPTGIGKNGVLSREYAESKEIFDGVTDILGKTNAQIEYVKKLLKGVKKSKKLTRKQKIAMDKSHRKNLKLLEDRALAAKKEMKHYKDKGRFSTNITDNLGLHLPNGPRRSVLSADEFLSGAGQRLKHKVFAPLIYPGSIIPTASNKIMSYLFREPMRVLESHIPGGWDLIRGAEKQKQLFVNGTAGKINRILGDAGVFEKVEKGKTIKKLAGVDAPKQLSLNKTKDKQFFDLMNLDADSDDFKVLWELTDPKMQKGVTEMREVLDNLSVRLGVPKEKYITGYMPHIMKRADFVNGSLPPEFYGVRKIGGIPWFMKERIGGGDYIEGAAEVLDLYVRGAAKYLYTDPALGAFKKMTTVAAEAAGKPWLNTYADDIISNMRGEPSFLGKFLDNLPFSGLHNNARRFAAGVGTLTYSAALTGNIRYPIMSIAQAINTTSAQFGALRTLKGLAQASTAKGRAMTKAAGLADEHQKIFEGFHGYWTKLASESRPLGASINDTEAFIRGITFHASLDENLTKYGYKALGDIKEKGLQTEIIARATRDSESVNHVFGVLGKPVWMNRVSRSGAALATQFFSFPFKQTETIVNNALKNPGFFADYLIMAGQMQNIARKANIDLSSYIGVGYTDMLARDMTSIPLDVIKSSVIAMQGIFDIDLPPDIRDKRIKDFYETAKMMVPARIAFRQRKTIIQELASGERVQYRTGDKKRNLNLSMVAQSPHTGGGNEFLSIVTRLQSQQEKVFRASEVAQRVAKGNRSRYAARIAKEIHDATREGRNWDTKKLYSLRVELSKQGVKMSDTDLLNILDREESTLNLVDFLKDSPMEFADRYRSIRANPNTTGRKYK